MKSVKKSNDNFESMILIGSISGIETLWRDWKMTQHWGLKAENWYLTHNIGIWGYQRGKKSRSGWWLLHPFKIVWVIWLNMNGGIKLWKGNINQHNQQSHVETSFWTLRSEQYTTNNKCLICGVYLILRSYSNDDPMLPAIDPLNHTLNLPQKAFGSVGKKWLWIKNIMLFTSKSLRNGPRPPNSNAGIMAFDPSTDSLDPKIHIARSNQLNKKKCRESKRKRAHTYPLHLRSVANVRPTDLHRVRS